MNQLANDPVVTVLAEDGTPQEMPFSQLFNEMEMSIVGVEMSVSCGEKFQKRPFEMKDYHSSMKFDISALYSLVNSVQDPQQKVQARNAVAQLIHQQVVRSDKFQRGILRYLAQLDQNAGAKADIEDRAAMEAQVG